MVSQLNMPHIIADAFDEMNKIQISDISIGELLHKLKKQEFKYMSLKGIAREIHRRSGLSFRELIEELSNSHRISPIILMSTILM